MAEKGDDDSEPIDGTPSRRGGAVETDGVLRAAIARLLSLHEGEEGVLDVVGCGRRALPVLRDLLFRREPSGLYQPRCHVVDALASLGAHDILIAFLENRREISDPVEAAGEEAVINAAARALLGHCDDHAFAMLLTLVEAYHLSGPIEVLGASRRMEALPAILASLDDDVARPAAEEAIRRFGRLAVPSLLRVIPRPTSRPQDEPESSRRKRRSSLALLVDLDASAEISPEARSGLMEEDDDALSLLGCRLALDRGSVHERQVAVHRLIDRLERSSSLQRKEIEDLLVRNGDVARRITEAVLSGLPPQSAYDYSAHGEAVRTLLRIKDRTASDLSRPVAPPSLR